MNLSPFKHIKKIVPQTLFGRSLMIIITPAMLLQLLVLFFFVDRHWDAMTTRLAQALSGEISYVLNTIDTRHDAFVDNPDDIELMQDFRRHMGLHFLYEANATIESSVATSQNLIINEVDRLRRSLEGRIDYDFIIRSSRDEKWYEILIQMDRGVLRVNFPARRLYTATSYIFLLWLIGSATVLFAIAIIFMRNQIRPIHRLAIAAERFGRGEEIPPFKPTGAREVRLAARSFIDMQNRIKRQVQQRTDMLSGVSHDLRTPLTRMKLQLEMMSQNADTHALQQDVVEMENMIRGYLDFAKGDGDERHIAFDIGTFMTDLIEKLKRQQLNIETVQIESGHILRLRKNAIERALSNFIVNACKFGDTCWVSLYRNHQSIEITIDDNGPGIPVELREDVFKPFYRIEDSRNPDTGGIGLGLAIAQDIINGHGGKIMLKDSPHGGLQVIVQLPLR